MASVVQKFMHRFDLAVIASVAAAALAAGCNGQDDEGEGAYTDDGYTLEGEAEMVDGTSDELGQAQQALWGYPDYSGTVSSCSDPTGTDSVLAALAVATAKELRRWQPTKDFYVTNGTLQLTATGKQRCADGLCKNTQALLDMQKSYYSVEVRPGVKVTPSTLRIRLTYNHAQQVRCTTSYYNKCVAPDHEFRFLAAAPGPCDMNYSFAVSNLNGAPLSTLLSQLADKLIWVDIEDNSYIKFQTAGSTVTIDPTYGLNEGETTTVGSCSAACTKFSSTSVLGQCCSCNGTKTYKRSAFSASIYLCQ